MMLFNPPYDQTLSGFHPRSYRLAKRMTDIIFSAVLLMALLPLLAYVACRVKLSSPGRIFFSQPRAGFQGKIFIIHKFRTLYESQCHLTGGPQVDRNDNRQTSIGRWLRDNSLDELPQLWNVLKGDMSLVGPRPHAIDHHTYYVDRIPHYNRRLDVLPGLTGLAQLAGCRGATPQLSDMQQRFDYDQLYITQQSYKLDLKILWLSFRQRVWHCPVQKRG